MNLEHIKEQIREQVSKNPEIENCGLVLYNDVVFPCKNQSKKPAESFIIHPEDFEEARKNGTIIGFYHNHPVNSDFSELDKLISEQSNLKCFLYNLTEDSLSIYEPKNYEIPYINRPFIIGIFDCLVLVQDYYQREFNIKISDITHKDRLNSENWKDSPDNHAESNILLKHLQENGFSIINNLQKGDVILARAPNILSAIHHMIYLGNNNILHQPIDNFSKIEIYSEYYKNRTVYKLRHRSLL